MSNPNADINEVEVKASDSNPLASETPISRGITIANGAYLVGKKV